MPRYQAEVASACRDDPTAGIPRVARVGGRREEYKDTLASLVSKAGERGPAIEQLLRLIFPGSQAFTGNTHHGPEWSKTWRRERRVANGEVFAIYLALALPPGAVPTPLVELLARSLANQAVLDAGLDALPDELVEATLERLEDFEDEFPDDPLAAIVAFENLRPRMRTGRTGMFDIGADLWIDRLVLRSLRRVQPEPRRDEIVSEAYARIENLSGRLQLLLVAGHRENVGNKLISSETQKALEAQLRADIGARPSAALATERDLLRLIHLLHAEGDSNDKHVAKELLNDDGIMVGILRSGLSETMSQTIGEVTVQRESALPWQLLEALVAPDDLTERIRRIRTPELFRDDSRATAAVATALRYADGWRPESEEKMNRPGSNTDEEEIDPERGGGDNDKSVVDSFDA